MRSNNLVPLLTKGRDPGMGLRKGVVVSWNAQTAENSVLVGDTVMTNLPILNTSEAAILSTGNVVSILADGATWGILGRFTVPGTPEAVSALSSLRTESVTVSGSDAFTTTSFAYPSVNVGPVVAITVGPSGRLLILLSANISAQATAAANNTVTPGGQMGFELTGANTLASAAARALRVSGSILVTSSAATFSTAGSVGKHVLLTGLNPGLTTVTAMYSKISDAVQANISDRNITAIAL